MRKSVAAVIFRQTPSAGIASLEDALGALLFQRSTRKLTLTTAGRAFYEDVADSIERLERAGQAVLGEEDAFLGLVRIAAPWTSSMCFR